MSDMYYWMSLSFVGMLFAFGFGYAAGYIKAGYIKITTKVK